MVVDVAVPAAALAPEALSALRRAFGREVSIRLPRVVELTATGDLPLAPGVAALVTTDATTLADDCQLLGDAAGARALRHVATMVRDCPDQGLREAVDAAALLLGRWVHGPGDA